MLLFCLLQAACLAPPIDNLPETLNFDGAAVTCAFRGTDEYTDGSASSYWIRNDICGSNNIGDIVGNAVWERNLTVENRLGVKLNWAAAGATYKGTQACIEQIVASGDDSVHYFHPTGNASVTTGHNVYMRDMAQLPHLDLEQPWWWQFANDALSLDGKFTMDKLHELSQKVYKDVNGDGTKDAGDIFGIL